MSIKDKYTFVSQEEEDWASVMIKEGQFKDVVYNYGAVRIPQEENLNDDGTLPFSFEYNIIYNNNIPREEFGEDFFNLIGDVLVDIIQDQEEIKYVDND